MTKNKIFSLLLSLTGYTKDVDAFIELLAEKGYKPISQNQIRSWRRDSGNPAPDFVFDILFEKLFEKKEVNPKFFLLTDDSN